MPETPRPSLALPPIIDGCETIVEAYANISFLFVFRFFFSFQRNNIKLEYLYNRKEDWNFSISLRNFFFFFFRFSRPAWPFDPASHTSDVTQKCVDNGI